jgi:hypothetical protein
VAVAGRTATVPEDEEKPKVKITEVENRFSQFGRIRLLTFSRYFRDIVVDGDGCNEYARSPRICCVMGVAVWQEPRSPGTVQQLYVEQGRSLALSMNDDPGKASC